MTLPVMPILPAAPSRGLASSNTEFATAVDAFLAQLPGWGTKANELGIYLNALAVGGGQPHDAFLDDIAALTDPNADRLLYWNNTSNHIEWASAGTGIAIASGSIAIGSLTKAQLDTAVSDGNVCFDGDGVTNLTMATARFLGRTTASAGVVEELTAAQLKAALDPNLPTWPSAVNATEVGYLDGVTSAIQTQLDAKAPLASPALTGNPTAPTQTAGNNTTRLATTAFVTAALAGAQVLDSDLTAIAALTTTNYGRGLLTLADASAGRTALGVVIGTDVQAYDTQLTSLAGLSYSGNGLKVVRVNVGETGFELATVSGGGGGGSSAWGDIGGTLADQTDLQMALDAKLASSFMKAELDTAVSDGTVCFDGDAATNLTMATARVLARTTASTGPVEELTFAQVKAALDVEVGVDVQAYDANMIAWPSAVSATEVGYLDGVTSALQTQLDAKSGTGHSHASFANVSGTKAELDTAVSDGNVCFDGDGVANLTMATARFLGRTTASTGPVEELTAAQFKAALDIEIGVDVQAYDANMIVWPSAVSATEVGYLDGVTSAIQAQLNARAAAGANTDITALDQDVTITATGAIAATSLGFRGLPLSAQSTGSGITLALDDAGKVVVNTTGGWTIPANGTVAFPVGTVVTLFNDSGSAQNCAITTDTLRLGGTASTGTRSIPAYGFATAWKKASTVWIIFGTGVG